MALEIYEKSPHKSVTRIFSHVNSLLLLTVVIPTILSGVYFGLVASDIYVSESRYFVRSPRPDNASGIGQFLNTAGLSRSQDDSSAVQDFILSRDALARIEQHLHISASFSSPKVDRLKRLGGLDYDLSFEALLLYYQKRVNVNMDSSSSITTLRVEAFSPDEAYRINEMLLEMSEELVNQLNMRARQDMIQFASVEVEKAEAKAKDAAVALSSYRNSKGIFDPKQQSGLQLQRISSLQTGLVDAKTQLAQVQSASANSPSIPVLKQRIKTLESEIEAETAQVAGSNKSLSEHSPEYERLELDVDFAGKQLTATLSSQEQARNEAIRQQLYLERIVQPNKPEVAIEPRRMKLFAATFVLGLLSWGVLGLLLAGVREHRE